jgi:hypothetical protein
MPPPVLPPQLPPNQDPNPNPGPDDKKDKPQGEQDLATMIGDWLCKKDPFGLNIEVNAKIAALFGVAGKLQLGMTSHGQLFATGSAGGSGGVQVGADAGISGGLNFMTSEFQPGLSATTSNSLLIYADHVPGLGAGGDMEIDFNGGGGGTSIDGGPRAGLFFGGGMATMGSRTVASKSLCN